MAFKFFAVLALACAVSARQVYQPTPKQLQSTPKQLQPGQCSGVPSFLSTDRIVGGEDASDVIPWQVSVRQSSNGGGHFCGGTVLDSKTILSAAHCFTNGQSMSNYYIMAGSTERYDASAQIIEIANGVWTEGADAYNSDTMENDIVILKLSSPLTLGDKVQAACLPTADYSPAEGQNCVVSGWGTQSYGATSLPETLQWVTVPIVTNENCNNVYGSITDVMLCAGYAAGGKDSCQGDSGGPFVCNEGGSAIITGVVSFGYQCAVAGVPGVYARVTKYLDWINANMESGDSSDGGSTDGGSTDGGSTDGGATGGCAVESWKADGYCDDENNNYGCEFDGGDCCGAAVDTTYCNDCECKQVCAVDSWKADNYCDDENNTPGCDFDGGDCCGAAVNTMYCSACQCLEP